MTHERLVQIINHFIDNAMVGLNLYDSIRALHFAMGMTPEEIEFFGFNAQDIADALNASDD